MVHGTTLPGVLAGPPLSDREAVADACFQAFASIDHNEESLLRSSCTDDIYTDIASKVCNGYEELKTKVWDNVATKLDTIHYLTNMRVSIDSAASAQVTFTAQAVHCPLGKGYEGRRFTTGANYMCDAVKVEGVWKLNRMQSFHVWGDGDPAIMAGH
jgi:hypothetical protein